jgi:hypothetical protein
LAVLCRPRLRLNTVSASPSPCLFVALTLVAWGCGGFPPEEAESTCTLRAAIVGGSDDETFLSLTDAQENAVVQLRFFAADKTLLEICSGVLIADDRVLTVGHCVDHPDWATGELRFGALSDEPDHIVSTADILEHSGIDIAVVTFRATELPDGYATPIPLPEHAIEGSRLVGSVAVLAGHGQAEPGRLLARRFVSETVSAVEDAFLLVSGGDLSGACAGDSGGPLLGRALDGFVRVYGVLEEGTLICRGDDRYTRVDLDPEWEGFADSATSHEAKTCGAITTQGRCYGEVAVWCEQGQLERTKCPAGKRCGFSTMASGYRCIDPASDPCEGVPDSGKCDGSRALVCRDGALLHVDCVECADQCVIGPTSGRVACAKIGDR